MSEQWHRILNSSRSYRKTWRFYRDMLLWNPIRALTIIAVRLEKRTGFSFHLLFPRRRKLRAYELRRLSALPDSQATSYGNYILPRHARFNPESIIYSCGVGQDVRFDEAIHQTFGCIVYLFDPTPASIRFMHTHARPYLHFYPVAVSDHEGMVTLYADYDANPDLSESFSVHPRSPYTASTVLVEGCTIHTLMQRLGHTHLDMIKLDVEGAAGSVLMKMLDKQILPRIIVCELEAPALAADHPAYYDCVENLFTQLEARGYDLFRITQAAFGMRIELLAIRNL